MSNNNNNNENPILKELGEELLYQLGDVTFYIGSKSYGTGNLFVGSKNVYWVDSVNKGNKFTFSFYSIGLNAIFSSNEDFPTCIYCQVDKLPQDSNNNGMTTDNDDNDEDDEQNGGLEDEEYSEIRFIPTDSTKIQDIYEAFCKGALLNPDPEEEDEGNFYYNQQENDDDDEDEDEEMGGIEMPDPSKIDELTRRFENAEEDDDEDN
eukprot:gene5971-7438_t